jgi:hypothetical protein
MVFKRCYIMYQCYRTAHCRNQIARSILNRVYCELHVHEEYLGKSTPRPQQSPLNHVSVVAASFKAGDNIYSYALKIAVPSCCVLLRPAASCCTFQGMLNLPINFASNLDYDVLPSPPSG